MLTFGIICALVATASAGYASSSSGASSGLYGGTTYGSTYGSNYPYTNNYVGYSTAGGIPYAPLPIPTPYDFQQYFNALTEFQAKQLTGAYAGEGAKASAYASIGPSKRYPDLRKNLFQQQLAQQAYIQASIANNINAIRDQALNPHRYGGYYGGHGTSIGNRFGGASSYSSAGAGGGSTGTYGGVGTGGTYGGTYSSGRPSTVYTSGRPNYASSGGYVGSGHQTGFAHVSPPALDSRFGDEGIVSHSSGTPGLVGVSSFSSSSDVNGVRHRESGTSINNNGKVTTYYNRGA